MRLLTTVRTIRSVVFFSFFNLDQFCKRFTHNLKPPSFNHFYRRFAAS